MKKFPFLLVLVALLSIACENETIEDAVFNQDNTENTENTEGDDEVITNGDI